ncbi:MAG: LysR family transcriptional regulator [Oceanospirillaceae bacterium]
MQKTNNEFDQLDVRSLRILKYLLESRSISNTAEYIGLSQPATSRIVAQLRKLFGDPLLVRANQGYVLTSFAIQVYPRIGIALESIHAVLEANEFNISEAKATLRIASTDYGTISTLRPLYTALLQQAPGVNLEISNFTPSSFVMMEQGELDLALYADYSIPGDFHYRKLFDESYSLLVRNGHPLIEYFQQQGRLDEAQLAQWPRAEMQFPSTSLMHNDAVMQINSPEQHSPNHNGVKIRGPYFLAIVSVIEDSDTIIALPNRMCQYAEAHYGVKALPMEDSSGFSYLAIWHHRQHQRPLLRWVLDQLKS